MQARPHTVTESPEDNDEEDPRQVEHNLINGERKLEGLQDMFLVVSVPESLDGICLQANLDTGHTVDVWEFGDVGGKWEARRLLVTRRIINNCATFDDDGDLVPTGVPGDGPTLPIDDLVVYEDQLAKPVFEFMEGPPPPTPDTGPRTTFHSVSGSAFPMTGVSRRDRVKMANYMNLTQQQVQRKMLRGFTGNRYEPRPLEETETFDRLVRSVVAGLEFELDQLVEMEYVEDDEFEALRRAGVGSTRELFATDIEERLGEDERDQLEDIRGRMTANTHDILAKAREDRGNGE